jgi:hypothetical protein
MSPDDRKPTTKAALAGIGGVLRRLREEAAYEPVPENLLELAARLEGASLQPPKPQARQLRRSFPKGVS